MSNGKLYKRDSSLQDSDLALTGAPVALNFDLYNNSSAQTVNFTTSSTGAVTVSGGESYVTTSVSGNTITVTPVAVTPSAQTITVSQEADATYAAGSVTFTVSVTDATPVPTHTATFSVNGEIINTDVVAEGAAITFPTNPADINGKSFVGWATATINGTTNTAPEMVTSAIMGNSDITFYAVFAEASSGSASLTKMTSSDTFTANDKVVIVASGNVAMYQETVSNSYVNDYTFDNNVTTVAADDKNWFTVSAGSTSGTWKLGDATNGYVYNGSSNNLAISTSSSTDFTLSWNNTENKFTLVGNSRWLSYRSDLATPHFRMGGQTTGTASGVIYFEIYKYNTSSISYSGYCTTVAAAAVATPTFSPAAGTYTEVQNVTISCATTGAEIHYTLDGTTPDATSDLYSDPINIASTTTVKAIAVLGGESSAVATATYTINLPTVATPTFSPAAGTYTEAQNVTISTTTADATIYYTTDGTDPTTSSSVFSSPIAISTTTTVKAMAVKAGMNNSEVATATYAILEHAGTEADPYTVADARAAIDAGTGVTGVYAKGFVSEIVTAYNSQYGNISYNISADGLTTSDQLQAYRGKSYNGEWFTSANDIQVGDSVVVYGNLTKHNSTYEFAQDNQLYYLYRPVVTTPYTLTVSSLATGVNAIFVFNTANQNEPLIAGGAAGNVQVIGGTEIEVRPDVADGYLLQSLMVGGTDVTSQLDEFGAYTFTMTGDVTISATAEEASTPTGDKYVKVTTSSDLTDGQYLIVYEDGNLAFDGSLQTLDNTSNTISVTISNDEIEVTSETAASEFTIAAITNGYSIQSASGYYIGQTSDANGLQSNEETVYTNAISFDEGNANIVSGGAYLRYNSASNQARFRYYKSTSYTGQKAIQLYKKVEASVTYDLTINGYTTDKNGWNLIASPVATTPGEVENMLTNTYDLYRFNSTVVGAEWENYKNEDHNDFDIVPGQGYLYANSSTVTLKFSGDLYDGDGIIELANAGWNLIGNPFNSNATVDVDEFMIMNEVGSQIITVSNNNTIIGKMQGIFVHADGEGESVTFTPVSEGASNNNSHSSLNINLSNAATRSASVIDRAIVRFGEGKAMPKFQLFEDNTKLYIPQDNKEYAVVRSEAQGEMPVNFKAAADGTYTISVEAENLDVNYLHLIDNKTGMDIDLMATPSYTFEGKRSDYASRFRLVFSANNVNENDNENESFAFISDGNIIISGAQNATVQVVDMLGRVVVSRNSVNTVSTEGIVPGVYVIRVIDGENVRAQKIVVR